MQPWFTVGCLMRIILTLILAFYLTSCTPTKPNSSDSEVAGVSSSQDLLSSSSQIFTCTPYSRDLYRHWIDSDSDCQDTRQEVLNQENFLGQSDDCKITSGQWKDPYSDSIFTDPSLLDVDHLVPLAEAHRSGAYGWTSEQREAFANDLSSDESLIAVWLSQNRSKGDKDPSEWLPLNEDFHKIYALQWVSVKVKWQLTADSEELKVIREIIGNDSLSVGFEFPIKADEVYCESETSSQDLSSSSTIEFDECGSKTTCGEMTSCDEALYFLDQCGVSRLDGDGNGTPCESICG